MSGDVNESVERQRDAMDRVDGLLERAQKEPQAQIGEATIIAELVSIRADLLSETRIRSMDSVSYVHRNEFEPFKTQVLGGLKWFSGLVASFFAAGFAYWLGTRGGE